MTVCPSGLRGQTQVLMCSHSWVQIPLLSISSPPCQQFAPNLLDIFFSNIPFKPIFPQLPFVSGLLLASFTLFSVAGKITCCPSDHP